MLPFYREQSTTLKVGKSNSLFAQRFSENQANDENGASMERQWGIVGTLELVHCGRAASLLRARLRRGVGGTKIKMLCPLPPVHKELTVTRHKDLSTVMFTQSSPLPGVCSVF